LLYVLFVVCPNVFVLLVERLGDRLGSSEDGLILREGCGQRRDRFGASLRGGDSLASGRLLRPALVLGNRFSRQKDGLVSGRRA
jgi:hypothetical protein